MKYYKIKAISPYIGDFKNEFMEFIPYLKWISEVTTYDKIYISTHINRFFLYDFIDNEYKIPIYRHLSREELEQKGYIHKKVEKQDYNLIVRKFKENIAEMESCSIKDIELISFPYTKTSTPIQYNKKIFKSIDSVDVEINKEHKNKIVFIASKNDKKNRVEYIYNCIKKWYNEDIIIIGDFSSYLHEENVIINEYDYFCKGYKYIYSVIMNAKCVICPLSHWTIICNLQKVPVFSWGRNPGQYRKDEIYNFGNNKCITIPTDDKTNVNIIINGIKDFIDRLK